MSEKTKKAGLSSFAISMTYVGCVIGAGYASGQELLQYFSSYGAIGLAAVTVAGILFAVIGYVVIATGTYMGTSNYEVIVSPVDNKTIKLVLNIFITFFALGVTTIMYAGFGSMLNTLLGVDPMIGSIGMAIVVALIAYFALEGLVNACGIIVPFMVVFAVVIGIYAALNGHNAIGDVVPVPELQVGGHWIISAINYVSFNIICSMAVLVPMGAEARSRKGAAMGAAGGGAILGILAFILIVAELKNFYICYTEDMPMFALAQSYSSVVAIFYGFVLIAAIFSTAASLMYGVTYQLSAYNNPISKNKLILVVLLSLLCVFGSRVGFTTLVGTVYPFTGYIGMILLAICVYNFFKYKKKPVVTEE